MKYYTIIVLILFVRICLAAPAQNTIEKIAHEIHAIVPRCKTMSLAEMKAQRLQFLHRNENATAADLVKALTMKIDGYDVIDLLRSYDGDVCQECSDIIAADYELGSDAAEHGAGWVTISWAMWLGVLK